MVDLFLQPGYNNRNVATFFPQVLHQMIGGRPGASCNKRWILPNKDQYFWPAYLRRKNLFVVLGNMRVIVGISPIFYKNPIHEVMRKQSPLQFGLFQIHVDYHCIVEVGISQIRPGKIGQRQIGIFQVGRNEDLLPKNQILSDSQRSICHA